MGDTYIDTRIEQLENRIHNLENYVGEIDERIKTKVDGISINDAANAVATVTGISVTEAEDKIRAYLAAFINPEPCKHINTYTDSGGWHCSDCGANRLG